MKNITLGLATAMTLFASAAGATDIYNGPDGRGDDSRGGYENPSIWTGAYVGVHGGFAWGNATTNDDVGDWCAPSDSACIKKYVGPFEWNPDGAFGGVTIGYNRQLGGVVLGVEGDIGYMDIVGSRRSASSNPLAHQQLDVDGGFYAVAAARLGIAIDRTLVYGKGGYAYFDGSAGKETTNPGFTTHRAEGFSGFVYGGGVEHMLTSNVSVKVEYLHFDFETGDGDQTHNASGYTFGNHTDLDVDTVKAGLNYKF